MGRRDDDKGTGPMDEDRVLAERFEENRPHLRAVAYRMLGSLSEADDAVQEAWLRFSRAGTDGVENLGGWLTTIVARVCLNMLRSRGSRREESLDTHVPDPIVSIGEPDPEDEVLLADSVGLALLVVLQTLTPAERLAFVLHDMFAVPFEDIAPIVERSPAATRQLASRARRRVRGTAPAPETDLSRQREVVDAFLTASRGGDFEALVALLDPDVTLRSDAGASPVTTIIRGAQNVIRQALSFRHLAGFARPAMVNGEYGLVTAPNGRAAAVMALTVVDGRITEINILADPERLRRLDLTFPDA
jgi:RNA polymerase sigma factor (sigma-70 family)